MIYPLLNDSLAGENDEKNRGRNRISHNSQTHHISHNSQTHHISITKYIYIYTYNILVGGFKPLKNISQLGMIIPNIWKIFQTTNQYIYI